MCVCNGGGWERGVGGGGEGGRYDGGVQRVHESSDCERAWYKSVLLET